MNELVELGANHAIKWIQTSWQSSGNYDRAGLVVSLGLGIGAVALTYSIWQKAGADGNLLNPLRNSLDAAV